ncbi:hypothetical protein LUZ63_001425 [Rhynchospora breviuscula]|uniref:Uncharacterized protein n=1 Tax=Rhynchospora breviuscula TaxID=2022672 RepID=A0A9Q0CWU1_9POAL|nr:hypothetical protein LUZ63_001425 [Rhynchospora breviuscula]
MNVKRKVNYEERRAMRKDRIGINVKDLEAKKQKLIEIGTDASSIRTCTFCNIVCNSEKVFASHIASEKHISRVNGRPSKGLAQRPISQHAVCSANASTSSCVLRAPTVAQSVYCDLCRVTCNTQEMYNSHVAGQKHNKKIKNITIGDKPIEIVPARSTSPGTQTSGANDKDKNLFCDICKIMCDTQEMYNIHLSG